MYESKQRIRQRMLFTSRVDGTWLAQNHVQREAGFGVTSDVAAC
jgi:hypothetical protein